MSVLIKKMDFPRNCADCDLSNCIIDTAYDSLLVCPLLGQVDDGADRDEDCPLTEVFEHYNAIWNETYYKETRI